MANETLTTSQSALIATEHISPEVIAAHLPRNFILGLVCHDNTDGQGSNQKRFPVHSDLGSSSAGTEGVELSPTIELGMASSINLSPTLGVADMAIVTSDLLAQRLGGSPFSSVLAVMQNGTLEQRMALIGPDIRRMLKRGLQKVGQDGLDTLLAAPSTSVGTTNTDLTVLAAFQAVRQQKINQPHRPPSEWCYILPNEAVLHLGTELLFTSGAAGGAAGVLWGNQADANMFNRPADEAWQIGRIGSLFGYDVYELDNEMNVTANGTTDVLGFFGSRGNPARNSESYQGETPHGVYVERHPLMFSFDYNARMEALEIFLRARYIWGEISDLDGVKILADND